MPIISELINTGIQQYRNGEFRQAIATLASVPMTTPENVYVTYYLGACYFSLRDYQNAIQYLGNVLTPSQIIHSNAAVISQDYRDIYSNSHNAYAQCCFQLHQPRKALVHFKEAVSINHDNIDAMLNLAAVIFYFMPTHENDSQSYIDAVLRINPTHYKAIYLRARWFESHEQYNQAFQYYQIANHHLYSDDEKTIPLISSQHIAFTCYIKLGFFQNAEYEEAEAWSIREQLTLNAKHTDGSISDALVLDGQRCLQLLQTNDAYLHFFWAILINPNNISAMSSLATYLFYFMPKLKAESLSYINIILDRQPYNHEALHLKGRWLECSEQFDQAITYYRLAKEHCNPVDQSAARVNSNHLLFCLSQRGLHFFQNKQFAAAKTYYELALEETQTHVLIVQQLGVCNFNLGNFQQAVAQFTQLIEACLQLQRNAESVITSIKRISTNNDDSSVSEEDDDDELHFQQSSRNRYIQLGVGARFSRAICYQGLHLFSLARTDLDMAQRLANNDTDVLEQIDAARRNIQAHESAASSESGSQPIPRKHSLFYPAVQHPPSMSSCSEGSAYCECFF